MLINQAFAQTVEDAVEKTTAAATDATAAAAATVTPAAESDVLLWNIGLLIALVGLFYLLLIRPQQSRYREHSTMIKALKKGDKIVLQSGMIATIHEIHADQQEAVVDLYEGVRSRILRSAIAGRYEDIVGK